MKRKESKVKTIQAKRMKWHEVLVTTLAIFLFGGYFLWMGWTIYKQEKSEAEAHSSFAESLPSLQDTIAHTKVCMADDVYQGNYPTVEVSISNKTYYACDSKGTTDLSRVDSLRYAKDPITGARVDKSTAIIALHPDQEGKVMYFRSKETHNIYLDILKKKNDSQKQ